METLLEQLLTGKLSRAEYHTKLQQQTQLGRIRRREAKQNYLESHRSRDSSRCLLNRAVKRLEQRQRTDNGSPSIPTCPTSPTSPTSPTRPELDLAVECTSA